MHNAKVEDPIVMPPAHASNADNERQKACKSVVRVCVCVCVCVRVVETMGSKKRSCGGVKGCVRERTRRAQCQGR